MLLENGVAINQAQEDKQFGNTALHLAVIGQQYEAFLASPAVAFAALAGCRGNGRGAPVLDLDEVHLFPFADDRVFDVTDFST